MAQPPPIITKFSKELSRILSDYLSNSELKDKRIPIKDRLAIKLMLTLNKKVYQNSLLFRDFSLSASEAFEDYILPCGDKKKLHIESIYYTQDVLAKRLTIVSKHKSSPTNLHLLLLMFFRYSEDRNWAGVKVKRKKTKPNTSDLYFKRTEKLLKQQCKRLINIGAVSKTYREKYGKLQLISGNNSAELVEEISLFDVIETTPLPLRKSLTDHPVWYPKLLERIILSLNEKYSLLRSCGLPPNLWHSELSVSKLRDLKQLKKLANSCQTGSKEVNTDSAYKQAFSVLLSETKKVAGFDDFISFAHSAVGRILLKIDTISFDGDSENGSNLADTYSSTANDPTEMQQGLSNLLTHYKNDFTAITAYFFEQALILQRPLYSENGIFNDIDFCLLIQSDNAYSHLEGEKLANKLIRTTERIIKKHMSIEDAKKWLD